MSNTTCCVVLEALEASMNVCIDTIREEHIIARCYVTDKLVALKEAYEEIHGCGYEDVMVWRRAKEVIRDIY